MLRGSVRLKEHGCPDRGRSPRACRAAARTTELLEAMATDRTVLAGVPTSTAPGCCRPSHSSTTPIAPNAAAPRGRRLRTSARLHGCRKRAGASKRASASFATSRSSQPQRLSARILQADDVHEAGRSFADRGAGSDSAGGPAVAEAAALPCVRKSSRSFITSTIGSVPAAPPSTSRKRTELANLTGRVALVTGGRVKIGYQAISSPAALGRA